MNLKSYLKKTYIYVFFLLLAIPYFLYLGRDSIQIWDEARNTLNLLEMYKSKNYLVTTYQGKPDLWNTKPPLLQWIQLPFVNLFGFNEFTIRIPSAIAGFLTTIVIFVFVKKYTSSLLLGIFSAIILTTANGFIDIHSSRTGDYDAIMVLFATISALSFFMFIDTKMNKYIYSFFIFLTLGVLTKSIAILLLLPGFFIFIVFDKKLLLFLKNKHFYIGFFIFIFSVSSYYYIREKSSIGYINAVWINELFGRYTSGLEGNSKPFNFYYENFSSRLYWWIYFVPIGVFIGVFNKNIKIVRLVVFCSTIILSHFLIISYAGTKLLWYDLPQYPFMAIIISIALVAIYNFFFLSNFALPIFNNSKFSKAIAIGTLTGIFILPIYKTIKEVYIDKQEEYYRNNQLIPRYLKDVLYNSRKIEKNISIAVSSENQHYHTEYYIRRLQEKDINIKFADWKNLSNVEIVLIGHEDNLKKLIEEHYDHEILEHHQSDWNYWGIKKYRIIKKLKDFK